MSAVNSKDDTSASVKPKSHHLPEDSLALSRRSGNIRSFGVISEIMGSGVIDTLPLRVRCECDVSACEEIIEVTLSKRRNLRRSFPRGFIVIPEHAKRPNYVLLLKTGVLCVVENSEFTQTVQDL